MNLPENSRNYNPSTGAKRYPSDPSSPYASSTVVHLAGRLIIAPPSHAAALVPAAPARSRPPRQKLPPPVPEHVRVQRLIDRARKEHVRTELHLLLQEPALKKKVEQIQAEKAERGSLKEEADRFFAEQRAEKLRRIEWERKIFLEVQGQDRATLERRWREAAVQEDRDRRREKELQLLDAQLKKESRLGGVAELKRRRSEKRKRSRVPFVMPDLSGV